MKPPTIAPPPASIINTADIYYVFFRHKWKILTCTVLGLVIAAGLKLLFPPPFFSEAKLYIRYVLSDSRNLGAPGLDNRTKSPDQRGETIMNSEVEILTSLDLAKQAAEAVGPAKILGNQESGAELNAAAVVISNGLKVTAPSRSSIIELSFTHKDPQVAHSVLRELIDRYLKMHAHIHQSKGILGEFMVQETDQLRARLLQAEEDLRKARNKAGVVSIEEAKKAASDQMAVVRQQIYTTQAELAQRASILRAISPRSAAASGGGTDAQGNTGGGQPAPAPADRPAEPAAPVPADIVEEYRTFATQIAQLKATHQQLLAQFTLESPRVKEVRAQLSAAEASRRVLEEKYPQLVTTVAPAANTSTSSHIDPVAVTADVVSLQAKLKTLENQLNELRTEAAKLDQLESDVAELRRKKELDEANYKLFAASLEQSRISEALGNGRISNISQIQLPTPPISNTAKQQKMLIGIAVGGLALGVLWAFLIEYYIDRSVRRPVDIERTLHLPLFLSIPRLKKKQLTQPASDRAALTGVTVPRLPEGDAKLNGNATPAPAANGTSTPATAATASGPLDPFHETLRDRLIAYFESRGLVHKPKLVAVTSLSRGAGVTTTAAGLARSLSETGEGNVLLVDMTAGQGSAQQFMRGSPVCGMDGLLEARQNAQVDQNLYVIAENSNSERLSRNLPQRFTKLVPKLKASDFDYIVFDMPVINQISITPRMAGFMDMVLMVVESEKTDRELVHRASELLQSSKAHVGVILNKSRNYVPRPLQSEMLTVL